MRITDLVLTLPALAVLLTFSALYGSGDKWRIANILALFFWATHSTRPRGASVPDPVLAVRDLIVEFATEDGVVHAVDGISWEIYPGEVLGIVGESGSGKSVSTMSLLGLIPQPPGRIVQGEAVFKGQDLIKMKKRQLRQIRGREMAMIFQDPMTSLNPVLTIGDQLGEAIKTHFPDK